MKCKHCKWWGTDNRAYASYADCMVFPPKVLDNTTTLGNTYSYKRPVTNPDERCSLFELQGTKQ